MTPELVDQASGAPRAAVAAQQDIPAFIELVRLRLDLRQQRLQLLTGLMQIIGFLPLMGPDVATLAAQVLQHLHLHRHRLVEQHQLQLSGQQGQAAFLIQGHRCLKTAVVRALGHLATAGGFMVAEQTHPERIGTLIEVGWVDR